MEETRQANGYGYKIAFVQDWLVDFGGAERCLDALCTEYPEAVIYTLFHDPKSFADSSIDSIPIKTTFLNHPFFKKRYRTFLPLYPFAVEQIDVGDAQLVLSFSHSVAKGVLTRSDTLHICYCHTPVRYAWDLYHDYLRISGLERGVKSWAARLFLHYIRLWDASSSPRVDHFIANSRNVARRISRTYGREARVIYPPVEIGRFSPASQKGDHFLVAGRLVPYKRADIAVRACTALGMKLRVAGDGPELEALKKMAGPTVTFLGRLNDLEMASEMASARALLFCGEEDFGITPVEAQAAGTPVIAFGKGGALETVTAPSGWDYSNATGLLFEEQNPKSLAEVIRFFETASHRFLPAALAENARRFDLSRYVREMKEFLGEKWDEHSRGR